MRLRPILIALLVTACTHSSRPSVAPWRPDLGDGRYRNPVIFADYSDPDVIRVGDDYFMTASSFGHVPGLPILQSKDLVNWTIVNHAIKRLPSPDFDVPQHGNGVWAPSIREHDGWFYIYYGDPDRGIYVVRTRDIRGEWESPVLVKAAKGWIDPSPLWDDDGNAYLVHAFARSRSGIKHRLHVNRMSADGLSLLDDGRLVFVDSVRHPTMEGPKFYKHDGWYYIFAPSGGVPTGVQVVLRSRSVYGPYEDRIVLSQGETPVNGPHQGGWVRTPTAEDWFLHFQDRGPYGRIVHLQPMTWKHGWPVMGDAGEPVLVHAKPVSRTSSFQNPQTSDEFDSTAINLAWQWNANPQPSWWSVRDGALRLVAQPRAGANLWSSPNLLLQKFPAGTFTATTKLSVEGGKVGDIFALTVFGLDYAYVGVRRTADGGQEIVHTRVQNADREPATVERVTDAIPVGTGSVWLRVTVTETPSATTPAQCQFSWSTDGQNFTPVGKPFSAREGKWVGAKVGLVAVGAEGNRPTEEGVAKVEWFRIQ